MFLEELYPEARRERSLSEGTEGGGWGSSASSGERVNGEGESYQPACAVWRKRPRPFPSQCSGLRLDARPSDLEFVLHAVLPLKPRNEV